MLVFPECTMDVQALVLHSGWLAGAIGNAVWLWDPEAGTPHHTMGYTVTI